MKLDSALFMGSEYGARDQKHGARATLTSTVAVASASIPNTLAYILAPDIAKLPMFFRHCCPNVIEGTSRN
jgi:hypothetical protein